MIIDNNFTWKQHVEKVVEKARKKMKGLCGLGIDRGLSVKALLRGWEVLVRPVLEFSAEIWGEKVWKQVESLQAEMGRRILGVSRITTNSSSYSNRI